MYLVGAVVRALADRRAMRFGALACDIAPDPLSPDFAMVGRGMVEAMSRSIVESRPTRIRFLPCGFIPYQVSILPPKRSSCRPRLSVGNEEPVPDYPAPPAFSSEIPFVSVRIKMPVVVEDRAETVWVEPAGKGRVGLRSRPAGFLAPDHAAIGAAVAVAAAFAASGHFRGAMLALVSAALQWLVASVPSAWMHVSWLSAIAIACIALRDPFPSISRDPVRILLYAYVLPLMAIAFLRRIRARIGDSSAVATASNASAVSSTGEGN